MRKFWVFFTAALILLCVLAGPRASGAALQGLELWAGSVLPALLPFFILSQMLLIYVQHYPFNALSPVMRFLGLPAAGAPVFILSLLCGYPSGARLLALRCSNPPPRLAYACHFSGPVFVTAVAAPLAGWPNAGLLLLFSHWAGVLASICLLPGTSADADMELPPANRQPMSTLLGQAVKDSLLAITAVAGYMVLFSLLLGLAGEALPSLKNYLAGLLEMTIGLSNLPAPFSGSLWALPYACGLLSFSGLCIQMQAMSFLHQSVHAARFFAFRLFCALVTFCLCALWVFCGFLSFLLIWVVLMLAGGLIRRKFTRPQPIQTNRRALRPH